MWFDDEIELFYKLRPQFRNLDVGDLSKRYELRKSLKCNNYAWFIKNVYVLFEIAAFIMTMRPLLILLT